MCKCIICEKEFDSENKELETIRFYEENLFCSHGYSAEICKKCFSENYILTKKAAFLTVNDKMYYRDSLHMSWTLIRSREDIDYIFNREYYDVLNAFYRTSH